MNKRIRLTLRTKLSLIVVLIPAIALTLFLLQSLKIFEADKIAYVFDSSLSISRTRAQQVQSQIVVAKNQLRALILNLDSNQAALMPAGKALFDSTPEVVKFEVWSTNKAHSETRLNFSQDKVNDITLPDASDTPVEFIRTPSGIYLAYTQRIEDASSNLYLVVRIVLKSDDLAASFNDSTAHSTFLAAGNGQLLLAPADFSEKTADFKVSRALEQFRKEQIDSGTLEIKSSSGLEYLASFARVEKLDLYLISAVEKRNAMAASETLIKQAGLFFLLLLLITIGVSYFLLRSLTQAFEQLLAATKRIGLGQFGMRVDIKTRDEIEELGNSFNLMSEEVSRLLGEASSKARMESELQTAKTIQDTLFPDANAKIGALEIAGFYEPASECGGDWWYYSESEDYVNVYIGDVTGHGVPSALVVSATHAARTVMSRFSAPSPAESLKILNEAVLQIAKGKMMMTFLAARIHKKTGLLTYSLASHEPAILATNAKARETGRARFDYLNDNNGPRLGDKANATYTESSVQLSPGDQLVLFTDGINGLYSPDGEELGERRMLRLINQSLDDKVSAETTLKNLIVHLKDWRKDAELVDDVTAVVLTYGH